MMTREELFGKVKAELGDYQLTSLKERTINEELDDVLEDFGDDEEANSKIVTRVANRLKRMEGNLHADVAEQVNEYKKNYKPKQKPKQDEEEGHKKPKADDGDSKYNELLERFNKMEQALKESEARKQKDAVLGQVKNGLKGKFSDADMSCNEYFLNAALSKVEIPEEDADVASLIEKAEKLYNAEIKAAGVRIGAPRSGGDNMDGNDDDEDDFSDIANLRKRYNPSADTK